MEARPVAELLDRAVREGVFPGAQLLVASEGRVLYYEAVGAAQLAPEYRRATVDTVYDLASLTKPLATTLIAMRLHDRGLLDLDAEVRPGVRVHHLLSHSSGLPAHRRYWEDPRAKSREDFFALAAAEPLEYEPGTKSVYSDVGFLVLGAYLERIGGARLDRQLFELEPRGPQYPGLEALDAAATEGTLVGVVHDENARAMGGVAPHAGLFGDAYDVHVRLSALTSGDLIERRTLDRFFQPKCGTFGLGWDHPAPEGYTSAGKRFPTRGVGHLGFTGCSIWMDPERPFWVILLSNRIHPSRENDKIREFRPLLHDAVGAASGLY